ncbi:MAG: PKD domain-containing protein [Chloroflexi bacterium]|nr:PKD domain-containing protein [Chloroflexota bacterium]
MKKLVLACALAGIMMLGMAVLVARADGPIIVDLGAQEENIRIIGMHQEAWMGEVTVSGDVNGDGYGDVIVGASAADYAGRDRNGAVYVILGRSAVSPTWQIAADPINVIFYGAHANDYLGHSVGSGDMNGDGISDVIIGADGYNGLDGAVYVFLGRTDVTTATQYAVDLGAIGAISPSLIVYGHGTEKLGRSVHAGDVNNDGYDDLIAGAYYNDPGGRTDAGATYVIMGGSHLTTTSILTMDLAIDNAAVTILGAEGDPDGSGAENPERGDFLGRSVSSGDINGDNFADVIVGAQHADSPIASTTSVGLVYVITGSTSVTLTNPITYDLSTTTDTAKVAVYHGVAAGDETGFYVTSGNLNGDIYDDVLIAAYKADAYWADSETGKAYAVYGQETLSATVYLSTEADITIYGAQDDERLGRSIASGDVINNGYDDIIIGASWADRSSAITNTGRVYVISGGTNISTSINLSETNASDVRILGDDGVPPGYEFGEEWHGDELGRSVAVGDIDDDGAEDIIAGAVWAENAAGEVYVIYGGGPITLSIAPTNQTISSGQPITFTVVASRTPTSRDVSAKTTFTIEVGAGGSWGSNVYTPSVSGTWMVTATYWGAITTTTITVTNDPPTADVGGPYSGDEGSAIPFDASFSSDPEGASLIYAWDFDDDSAFDDGTGATPSNTWDDDNTYTVTLRVTDSGGLTDTDAIAVTVNNVTPTIQNISDSTPANEGTSITVIITATDPGDDTLTYGFDWDGNGVFTDPGDILSQSSNQASHIWANDGSYDITVRVDDGDGGVVTDTHNLVVDDTGPTAEFHADVTSGSEALLVSFTDDSTAYDGVASWEWDFGDGSPLTTTQNPSHQYDQDGVYTVTLTVEDGDGSSDSEVKTSYITVTDTDPTAEFHADVTSGIEPLLVSFTDDSTAYDGVSSWEWDFGDGSPLTTTQSPSHQYGQDGVYTVTLTVEDGDGSSDSEVRTSYVTVNDSNPTAEFHADVTSGIEPLTVSFTDDSTAYDGVSSWEWDFGDGSPLTTTQSPSHQYDQDGVYTITLTVEDGDGSSDSEVKTSYVTVNDSNPTAEFHADVTSGIEPLTVSFTDDSTAYDGVSSWEWDFGNGSPLTTTQSPSHQYGQDGVYTVTLTVEDGDGSSDSEVKTNYITVTDSDPTAEFIAAPTLGSEPLTVVFTDTSVSYDGIATWSWDLDGDGSTDATIPNPTFEYTSTGSYTVTLTVEEGDGDLDSETKTSYVNVGDTGPIADFAADPLSGTEPLTVVFTDTSTSYDGIISWSWDLDGDGSTDSTTQHPTHVYTASGVYTVTLTVEEADSDSDTESKVSYITVGDTGPTADFAADPLSGDEPLTVVFTDTSTSYDGIISWSWDLDGDGSTDSITQHPTHVYTASGVYTITLTVEEADSDSDTESKVSYITVGDTGPTADFAADPLSGDEPLTVVFTDTSVSYDGIVTWSWDLDGDGSTDATILNPTFEYTGAGSYTVTLTVEEGDGDLDSETKTSYISVGDTGPTASFTADPLSGDEPLTVVFTDTSTSYDGIISWSWDLDGDGSTDSTTQHPTFVYMASGVYTVTLMVEETDSDSDTESKVSYITVGDTGPTANFDAAPLSGTAPLTVTFTNTSVSYDGIITWSWDLNGDGLPDNTIPNPTFEYTATGIYTVTLIVWEADGDLDTETKVGYINVGDVGPDKMIYLPLVKRNS